MIKPVDPASVKFFHVTVVCVTFAVYLITAINSNGYFHFDEHYQIIEFANLKLGVNESSDLAWEYTAQMRSAAQPSICIALVKLLDMVNITDPYSITLALRLLSLLLSLAAITVFVQSSLYLVEDRNTKFYILLSYLLWFLPFINVRFSAESWSGSIFLFAVAILQLNSTKRKSQFFLVGFLLGLSFLCRFQSALLTIGLFSWLIFVNKETVKVIGILIVGGLIALICGIIIDCWFYETIVFTPWNYFNMTIMQSDSAPSFGTSPWNYYISTIVHATGTPIGCVILACLCLLVYKRSELLLLWVLFPFLIIHSLIPHKEDRFLFPLINFISLLITLGWQESYNKFKFSSGIIFNQKIIGILASFLAIINVLGLLIMCFSPMGNGSKNITQYIHQNYQTIPVNLIQEANSNLYSPLYMIPLNEIFYADRNVRQFTVDELLKPAGKTLNLPRVTLFACKKENLDLPDHKEIILKFNLKPKIQSIPKWIEWISAYNIFMENKNVLVLYGSD